jgi:hypothetical protein
VHGPCGCISSIDLSVKSLDSFCYFSPHTPWIPAIFDQCRSSLTDTGSPELLLVPEHPHHVLSCRAHHTLRIILMLHVGRTANRSQALSLAVQYSYRWNNASHSLYCIFIPVAYLVRIVLSTPQVFTFDPCLQVFLKPPCNPNQLGSLIAFV